MFAVNEVVQRELAKIEEVARYLWQREWAERNGGNISIDLTDIAGDVTDDGPITPLPVPMPMESAGRIYYVKGTGQRIRELRDPGYAGCILQMNATADGYRLLWGGRGSDNFAPTSEFISHIRILEAKRKSGSLHRSVLHTHPLELIALSHHPQIGKDSELFTNACWQMLPEVRLFIPGGISVIPYCLPSSEELAEKTAVSLLTKDVAVWEKHGAIASGTDLLEAFDYIDVANKGARLYLLCLASGFIPEGLSFDEMETLKKAFRV